MSIHWSEQTNELESGIRDVNSVPPECSLMVAYLRHPGRWPKEALVSASCLPGAIGDLTPEEAGELLDRVQAIRESMIAKMKPTRR